jgi:hypothetical protein
LIKSNPDTWSKEKRVAQHDKSMLAWPVDYFNVFFLCYYLGANRMLVIKN